MLDIGFTELMLIGVVALVVLGPERLPRVARTAGHLLGRFQRYVADVKSDINRELELAELKKLQTSVEDAARSIETTVKSEIQQAEQDLRSVEDEVNRAGEEIRKSHDELIAEASSGMSMPHMGMGVPASDDPASEDGQASEHPALADADDTPSPQMELGLAPEPVPAAGEPQPEPSKTT